jgi:hypothetical protein
MKAVRLISCFAACFLLAVAASPSSAQRPAPNPVAAACGSADANYTVKHSPGSPSPTQPPQRAALVYVIETMPDVPWVTKKVNIGLDAPGSVRRTPRPTSASSLLKARITSAPSIKDTPRAWTKRAKPSS